jgi:hypothetical protein
MAASGAIPLQLGMMPVPAAFQRQDQAKIAKREYEYNRKILLLHECNYPDTSTNPQ